MTRTTKWTIGGAPSRTATGGRRVLLAPVGAPRLSPWLCVVQAILSYEWLVSGLNKLLAPTFGEQLAAMLRHGARGSATSRYVALLYQLVLPHHVLFAHLTSWSETLAGGVLLLSAALWLVRPHARVTVRVAWAACLALLAAVVLDLTAFSLGVGGLPWIDPANATKEGSDIDVLLSLLSLALFAANLGSMRAWSGEWHGGRAGRRRSAGKHGDRPRAPESAGEEDTSLSRIRVLVCRVDDPAAETMTEMATFALQETDAGALHPAASFDELETPTDKVHDGMLQRVSQAQWVMIDATTEEDRPRFLS